MARNRSLESSLCESRFSDDVPCEYQEEELFRGSSHTHVSAVTGMWAGKGLNRHPGEVICVKGGAI